MRRSSMPEDSSFVSMDRARPAGQTSLAGAGYRLAAGGLGRRWSPAGEDGEEPCLEDEFVQHTARAWTQLRGVAARLPDATRAGATLAAGQVARVPLAIVCQATALCALAAIGASTALYWQKSRTAGVDHEIGHVVGEMAQAEAQTGRLRAQWLALNDPARLQDAAARYSGLRPLAPAQFVDAGKLADHLPAPGAVPQDGGTDTVSETAIAGDAMPVFKPVTAQAASLVVPAAPAQADLSSAAASLAQASPPPVAPVQPASVQASAQADADPAHAAAPVAPAAGAAGQADVPAAAPQVLARVAARAPAPDEVWDTPDAPAPRRRVPAAMRPAMAAAHVASAAARAANAAVLHAAGDAVRAAPPALQPRPHAPPRMLMARFDMPHWLMQTHAPHPAVVIMSAPPHALSLPRDTSVLEPGARHTGEPALEVKAEPRASEPEARSEPPPAEEPRPAPVYRRPAYQPYYGYGYGSPYGYSYQAPPRYYGNPYGGYSSQPYGGPYYQ